MLSEFFFRPESSKEKRGTLLGVGDGVRNGRLLLLLEFAFKQGLSICRDLLIAGLLLVGESVDELEPGATGLFGQDSTDDELKSESDLVCCMRIGHIPQHNSMGTSKCYIKKNIA